MFEHKQVYITMKCRNLLKKYLLRYMTKTLLLNFSVKIPRGILGIDEDGQYCLGGESMGGSCKRQMKSECGGIL